MHGNAEYAFIHQIFSNFLVTDEEEIIKSLTQQEFNVFLDEGKISQLSPSVLVMSTCLDQSVINNYIDEIKRVFKGQDEYILPTQLNGKIFFFGPYTLPDSIVSISKIIPDVVSLELEVQQRAFVLLFEKVFSGHFFSLIRTSDQMAYILHIIAGDHFGINYIEFAVQSPRSPQGIEDRIYEFIRRDASAYLDSQTDDDLLRVKDSFLHSFNFTKIDFLETAEAIISQRPSFDFIPKVVKFLESLTSAQVIRSEMKAILEIVSEPTNGFKMIIRGKQ